MDTVRSLTALLFFPSGLFVILTGLASGWLDRKLIARLQNRLGPRWFQPLADIVKLLAKEEVIPVGVHPAVFIGLPLVALAGALTAALYVPLAGLPPVYSFPGDLIVTVYLLSLLTLCTGLAGAYVSGRFSLVGAVRSLTQLFAYEAPFLLALLGPAMAAGSWQISDVTAYTQGRWLLLMQPVGFLVALIGLMGKLQMAPFDAPSAETEIVAGALTEYSGRGLAVFKLGHAVELMVGLALIATFYLGSVAGPINFFAKTAVLLLLLAGLQTLMTRLRIDQTVGLWWRYGVLLALLQFLVLIGLKAAGVI
jgi:NADH-quinone oxidoreductase subunit H